MDRASGYGPEGWGFESLQVHKRRSKRLLWFWRDENEGLAVRTEEQRDELVSEAIGNTNRKG